MTAVERAELAPAHLDRWRIPREAIAAELALGQKPQDQVCLGCAAKVDLVDSVYPVLKRLGAELRAKAPQIALQPREDVYIFPSDGKIELDRGKYGIAELLDPSGRGVARVAADFRRFRPTGVVLLASFTAMPKRDHLYDAMWRFYEGAIAAGSAFTVGKGHTIQISKTPDQAYFLCDYVRSKPGPLLYGCANNDTISTIDPNLRHSSWISVFVALNNALNDLFLGGVYRGLEVYPTYDARDPADVPRIKEAIRRYADTFGDLGIEVRDLGPLGYGTKSMGATVVGFTERELTRNANLKPGQVLLATRPIGDLAPLTEYLIRQSLDEPVADLEDVRLRVIETMLIPNVEVAKVIARHLPKRGEPFDPARHVQSARDMSGPGILAVEELAEDSQVDIYLDRMAFQDPIVPNVGMPNPTAGTNGAIIIACYPDLAREVLRELEATGHRPWVIGEVAGTAGADGATILVNEDLRGIPFVVGRQKGLFDRSRLVPRRPLPV